MQKTRVAVLLGGRSAERQISLMSGVKIAENLDPNTYQVLLLDTGSGQLVTPDQAHHLPKDSEQLPPVPDINLAELKEKIDVAFIALHGRYGEDGTVQGLLKLAGISFTGSDVLASALAMDKEKSKLIYQAAGLPVLKHEIIVRENQKLEKLKLPLIIKPNQEGSSIGITICRTDEDFATGVRTGLKHDKRLLVEPYIEGIEVTASVLEKPKPTALPVIEIVPQKAFFNYEAKYDGTTAEIVPARISDQLTKKVQDYGVRAHNALGCRHFSRTDLIIDKTDQIYLIETNTIPGLTSESLFPKAAKAAGIEFPELLSHLITLALQDKIE